MQHRSLGRNGYRVSEVGFGAWTIGSRSYGPVEQRDALAALDAYVEAGGNFIDTARGYNVSEAIIGQFLKASRCRDRLVISSKVGATDAAGIADGVEQSLKTMGIDVVDVYHLHGPPDDPDAMNRCFDAMDKLREQGKIVSTAASIKGPHVTPHTQQLCRQYITSGRCDVIQLIYSLLRQSNRRVFDLARAHGVGLIGRTALESGFLGGRYRPGHRFPEGDHRRRWTDDTIDHILAETQRIAAVVQPPYAGPADLALRYALDEPALSTVIVGARDAAQARANVKIAHLPPLPADWTNRWARAYARHDAQANPA